MHGVADGPRPSATPCISGSSPSHLALQPDWTIIWPETLTTTHLRTTRVLYMMNREVELGPADRDESRPFAHQEHNDDDIAALAIMAARLRQLLAESECQAPLVPFPPHELRSPQGRCLRGAV